MDNKIFKGTFINIASFNVKLRRTEVTELQIDKTAHESPILLEVIQILLRAPSRSPNCGDGVQFSTYRLVVFLEK